MPLLRRTPPPDADGFYQTGIPAGEITAESLTRVKVSGQVVLLTRSGGSLVAFSSICPHAAADLSKGRFVRGQVKCPDHGYTFDVRTGCPTWPEDEVCRLKRFTAVEEAGLVKIRLTAPEGR